MNEILKLLKKQLRNKDYLLLHLKKVLDFKQRFWRNNFYP